MQILYDEIYTQIGFACEPPQNRMDLLGFSSSPSSFLDEFQRNTKCAQSTPEQRGKKTTNVKQKSIESDVLNECRMLNVMK